MPSGDHPEKLSITRRLRDVPLPPGLIARLEAISQEPRQPPLPEPMAADNTVAAEPPQISPPLRVIDEQANLTPAESRRLAQERRLDRKLAAVPVPPGMLQRLQAIAGESAAQPIEPGVTQRDALDAALTDIAIPRQFGRRLRAIAWRSRARQWATGLAAAASLALAAWLGWFWSSATQQLAQETGTTEQAGTDPAGWAGDEAELGGVVGWDSVAPESLARWLTPEPPLAATDRGDADPLAGIHAEVPLASDVPRWETPGWSAPQVAATQRWLEPFIRGDSAANGNTMLPNAHTGIFAAEASVDDYPRLSKLPSMLPRGTDPPTSPAFDLIFFRMHGVHPFVAAAAVAETRVPLGTDRSSYDLTRRHLADGELPPPEWVRTEEFLAAMNYRYEPSDSLALAIRTAGGPSPMGRLASGQPRQLLQVGAQASEVPASPRSSLHLVIAIDLSSSMQWGGRLEMVQQALRELLATLRPTDAISLIGYSEEAWVMIEAARAADPETLHRAINALQSRTATNTAAGLYAAYSLATEAGVDRKLEPRIVLITDDSEQLTADLFQRVRDRLPASATTNVPLAVLDLNQQNASELAWDELPAESSVRRAKATSQEQITWAMREVISGRPLIVAETVRMSVQFYPERVAAYRLLGHEATAVSGLMPLEAEIDMRAGQSATGLYELMLTDATTGPVATVTLEWTEPRSGAQRRVRQTINVEQFAGTFEDSAPSLQKAAVAAAAAEHLRESYFFRGVPLEDIVAMAERVRPVVRQDEEFLRLEEMLKRSGTARPTKARGSR